MPDYNEAPFYKAVVAGQFPIAVSLARHDIDLAKAALDAGATAIKTHLNAYHRATGTTFGSFAEERPFFEDLAKLGAPLLVMAGQETLPTAGELEELADMGFEGFNVYFAHLQPHLLESPLRPMPALSEDSTDADLERIAAIPGAMVEASIIPFSGYGGPMSDEDLSRYGQIVRKAGIPVIAPSQRRFTANDMPALRHAGVGAVLLGAIVTGAEPETVHRSVAEIVEAAQG